MDEENCYTLLASHHHWQSRPPNTRRKLTLEQMVTSLQDIRRSKPELKYDIFRTPVNFNETDQTYTIVWIIFGKYQRHSCLQANLLFNYFTIKAGQHLVILTLSGGKTKSSLLKLIPRTIRQIVLQHRVSLEANNLIDR